MKLWRCPAALIFAVLMSDVSLATSAVGEEEAEYLTSALSPSAAQSREELEEAGVTLYAALTADTISVLRGGSERGSRYAANYDLLLDFDTERLGAWSGGTFHFYVLANHGNSTRDITGNFQVASNIEAPDAIKLYEAYYRHDFDGGSSVLFGLHNYNSEFDVAQYGSVFVNSAFGIDTSIAQAGPSIFPTTAVALRGRWQIDAERYAMAGVYDGVPGDPDNYRGTHIQHDSAEGYYYAFEAGSSASAEEALEHYYKVALGGWYKTTETTDNSGNPIDENYGGYLVAERSLFREDDATQGLGIFAQFGYASPDRNRVGTYGGMGLNYTGLIDGRERDTTGLALNFARQSDSYIDENPGAVRTEMIAELTHRFKIRPYFSIQPDLQFVRNPAGDPEADNALIFITRVVTNF